MGHKPSFIKTAVSVFLTFSILCLASCGAEWETDLDSAKEKASSEDMDILLVITGYDWNTESVALKNNILDKKAFRNKAGDDYILLNLDYIESDFSYEEKNTGDSTYIKNLVRDSYAVTQEDIPCMFILSQEGYVISRLGYGDSVSAAATPEELVAVVEEAADNSIETKLRIQRLRDASGLELVYEIDSFVNSADPQYKMLYDGLVRQVPVLDAYDETGLLGTYELEIAYRDAISRVHEENENSICRIFTDICKNGHLSDEQKQSAYYTAAMVLAYMGSTDYDRMLELLQKAVDAAPDTEEARKIGLVMTSVRQYAFVFGE